MRGRSRLRSRALAAAIAALLGVGAAVLASCGSSSAGLIPAAQGGPLQNDIEAVERAAESGDGNCSATESALQKAERDYGKLPSSIDSGLRDKIHLGLENLNKVAREACAQPVSHTSTSLFLAPKTTSTETTQTQTAPPSTSTTQTTSSTPSPTQRFKEKEEEEETPAAGGGGTPAPGEGNGKAPGVGAGGAGAEEGNNGAGGSEGAGK